MRVSLAHLRLSDEVPAGRWSTITHAIVHLDDAYSVSGHSTNAWFSLCYGSHRSTVNISRRST